MNKLKQKAFTLVELAIVITIIGLLIGGVLKGQELLENARMTSSAAQLKSYTTAAITFKDIYKALPGDIISPGNFIANCTTSPCNLSGNGDGRIRNDINFLEEGNFWGHLARAGLINGIDTTKTWNPATYLDASFPVYPLGGIVYMTYHFSSTLNSNVWEMWGIQSGIYPVSLKTLAKLDLKVDDGLPEAGDYQINFDDCNAEFLVVGGVTKYDPNSPDACPFLVKSGI